MKLKFKKYVYLLNDITNQLLKKDREDVAKHIVKLQYWVMVLGIALGVSVVVIVWLLIAC